MVTAGVYHLQAHYTGEMSVHLSCCCTLPLSPLTLWSKMPRSSETRTVNIGSNCQGRKLSCFLLEKVSVDVSVQRISIELFLLHQASSVHSILCFGVDILWNLIILSLIMIQSPLSWIIQHTTHTHMSQQQSNHECVVMIIFPFPALIFRCVVSGYYSEIIGQNLFCQHNWIYPRTD